VYLGKNMNITILNGNPDTGNTAFDDYLARLSDELTSNRHAITGCGSLTSLGDKKIFFKTLTRIGER